ncbi:MAG: hypothetical protein ABSF26_31500, partial [Thermoguttaceae bacterium]
EMRGAEEQSVARNADAMARRGLLHNLQRSSYGLWPGLAFFTPVPWSESSGSSKIFCKSSLSLVLTRLSGGGGFVYSPYYRDCCGLCKGGWRLNTPLLSPLPRAGW